MYASTKRGGIPQYVIINLGSRSAEELLHPKPSEGWCTESLTHGADASLELYLNEEERLIVAGRPAPAHTLIDRSHRAGQSWAECHNLW
ncbi:MAG TPA: hypothetical protein VFY39_12325 [Gammaproteobacteria bacterium]|nr:hypothetical protein [Gammaproteobacteria bacterium]